MKIIKDTREKQGWDFVFYDDVTDVISRKIDCGDYTTDFLEGKIVIERKATPEEVANNLGKILNRKRFERELIRMEPLKKAYIVCEFPECDLYSYPDRTKKILKNARANGKYLMKVFGSFQETYPNIEIVFCNSKDEAEKFTYDILKFWTKYYASTSEQE